MPYHLHKWSSSSHIFNMYVGLSFQEVGLVSLAIFFSFHKCFSLNKGILLFNEYIILFQESLIWDIVSRSQLCLQSGLWNGFIFVLLLLIYICACTWKIKKTPLLSGECKNGKSHLSWDFCKVPLLFSNIHFSCGYCTALVFWDTVLAD